MNNRNQLLLKVCGMKHAENIRAVAELGPDFMGFIFYSPSPRYAGELRAADLEGLPASIRRVGVFVDASKEEVIDRVQALKLDYVQLHGNESPAYIQELASLGMGIIKVISGNDALDGKYMDELEPNIHYWLLDNRTEIPGGTGRKFDRSVLNTYAFTKPVLLSGGLDGEEVMKIRREGHPAVAGVDVNSKVEDTPGKKNTERIKLIINALR